MLIVGVCQRVQEFEVYVGSYRDSLLSTTQTKELTVNSEDACDVKYVSMAYIQRCVKHKQVL